MTTSHALVQTAQWLNDQGLWFMAVATLYACVAEWVTTIRSGQAHAHSAQRNTRWINAWGINVSLLVITLSVSWVLAPWLAPLFSNALSAKGGLLSLLNISQPTEFLHVVLGVLLLDLLTYAMHRAMHAVPILWRIHQIHHNDADMNASTHFRQHPAQMLLVLAVQLPVISLLGISGLSWVLYASLALIAQLWQHASLPRSTRAERHLGWLLVTPQFHRTHHDQRRQFHDTNYGALFSVWDHLFATSSPAPDEHRLGLATQPHPARASLVALLLMPFAPHESPAAGNERRKSEPFPKKFHSRHQGKI